MQINSTHVTDAPSTLNARDRRNSDQDRLIIATAIEGGEVEGLQRLLYSSITMKDVRHVGHVPIQANVETRPSVVLRQRFYLPAAKSRQRLYSFVSITLLMLP